MGAGHLACPILRNLLESRSDRVVAIITQPDRPAGRGLSLRSCPVKRFAEEHGLHVLTPPDASAPEFVKHLAALGADLIIVCDYGQFLKANLLRLPLRGSINVHPSLLPKYRGAAPIQWAIANGETETGVSVLYISERMDAGDIIAQEKVPIHDDDTTSTLEPLLAELGASLLIRVLETFRNGTVKAVPQNEDDATYAPRLKKEDGRVNWHFSAEAIRNRVRAFNPWPGVFFEMPKDSNRFVRILNAKVEDGQGEPGTVLHCGSDGPLIACGVRALRLLLVHPEARKPITGDAFVCGYRIQAGHVFG